MELFFRLWKYWKLALLWSKNQNSLVLSFGVSAITLLLIILLINVAYFWNRLYNAHLSTYQTVPSSIFDILFFGTCFLPKKGSLIFELKKKTADQCLVNDGEDYAESTGSIGNSRSHIGKRNFINILSAARKCNLFWCCPKFIRKNSEFQKAIPLNLSLNSLFISILLS